MYTNNRSEYVKLVEDVRALRKTDNEFNALVERVTHDVENAYKNEYVDSRVITRARLIEQEVTARLVEELLFDRKNASSSATKSNKGITKLLGISDEGILTRLKKFFTHLRNRLKGTSMSSEVQTVDDLISEIEELIAKGKIKKNTKSRTAIDNGGSLLYSKKSYYNSLTTLSMQWANATRRKEGDVRGFYDRNNFYVMVATGDGDYSIDIKLAINDKNADLISEIEGEISNGTYEAGASNSTWYADVQDVKRGHNNGNVSASGRYRGNDSNRGLYARESERNISRHTQESNKDISREQSA